MKPSLTRRNALLLVTTLTLLRLPLVLAFAVCAAAQRFAGSHALAWVALALVVLAALTDLFDGQLARRYGVTSRFGAMADPLMDKVFNLAVLPTLLFLIARHPGWGTHAVVMLAFTVVFLVRDQWVTFLRGVGSEYGADVRATWSGKLRTALAFPIACVIYVYVAFTPRYLPLALVYALEGLSIAVTLLSLAIYTRQYLPYLRRSLGLATRGSDQPLR